jgi:hypothetical protein
MKKVFFLLLVAILINKVNIAQTYTIPNNTLLKEILSNKLPITYITPSSQNIVPVELRYKSLKQQIVYNQQGLFVFIDGAGLVFKVSKYNDQEIAFTRLDSTFYYGYNTGSLKLMPNDTIYSFGGYGFWHFNGYLSYFDTKRKEWEIMLLNKEVPYWGKEGEALSSLFFVSSNHNLVYFTQEKMKQHGIRNYPDASDSLYLLDIAKKEIITKGKLTINNKLIEQFAKCRKIITPYGVLYDNPFDQNKDYLIDFANNKILVGNDSYVQKIISSRNNYNENIIYYRNNHIYSSCYPYDIVDSAVFSIDNFKQFSSILYDNKFESSFIPEVQFSNNFNFKLLILFLIILVFILFVLFRKRRSNEAETADKKEFKEESLNDLEIVLLKQFVEKLEKREFCTVEDLNNLLGVSSKTVEIKKKARTDFITKVNYKIKQALYLDYDMIKRNRSENDKRSYLYYIEKSDILQLKKLLS